MSHILGIMQGRFTEKGGFFPQEFPWENWQNEFVFAQRNDVDCVEWMFNAERFQENPIWLESGRKEIKQVVSGSGVKIYSICANYFMQNSIAESRNVTYVLGHLMESAVELNIRHIIIPLFGASEISDKNKLCSILEQIYELLKGRKLRIGFETDLPIEYQKFICEVMRTDQMGICYDVGNAAGKRRDCVKDILEISEYLLEVHIKDKNSNDASVMLGEGLVDFQEVFHSLKNQEIILILESYFNKNAKEDTLKNMRYVREKING